MNYTIFISDFDELYEKPVNIHQVASELEPHPTKTKYKGLRFGWSILIWNALTFMFSIVICSIARTVGWMSWGIYKLYR